MPKYHVIKSYHTSYPDSIRFRKGEAVTIEPEYAEDPAWKDWFWCTGENGLQAWAPKQYLKIDGTIGVLLKDYDACELNLQAGEILTGDQILNGFVLAKNHSGERGWAPLNHLEPVE